MIKKVLVIIPHQDDECIIAGTFIYDLRSNGVEVYVLYTTNGDYYPWMSNIRNVEAVHALEHLLVDDDHIIFLGYGNEWASSLHMYNCYFGNLQSCAGRTETYSSDMHPEYCYKEHKIHRQYTRENLKLDLKESILSVFADCIVCVDFDRHPDHRATSLLFEEVMRELIVEKDYRPIVLKKFAYASMWEGKKDFYVTPFMTTQKPSNDKLNDRTFELDNPAYSWENRIRFSVDDIHKRIPIFITPVLKAMREHRSQMAWYYTLKIVNDDVVFWWRNTNGLQYDAKITVSSGNPNYLTDFKYIDSTNIREKKKGIGMFDRCLWIPDQEDEQKSITIKFSEIKKISQISLFENYNSDSKIINVCIYSEDGLIKNTGELNHLGSETKIVFNNPIYTKVLYLKIDAFEGKQPGFSEIEVYDSIQNFNYDDFPIDVYMGKPYKRKGIYFYFDYYIASFLYLIEDRINIVRVFEKMRENRYLKKWKEKGNI